jgi:hypothetical protein
VRILLEALSTTGDATITIMKGITRVGINVSRELAQEIVDNPDILVGALLFMMYGAITTPMYEDIMPMIKTYELVDLGEPIFTEDYMGQLPPRFVHEVSIDIDDAQA